MSSGWNEPSIFALGMARWLLYLIVPLVFSSRPQRARENGFRYIYVEDDGSARELDADEQLYLQTEFEPGDGGRPYIKWDYEARTPDNRISGYLLRSQLPKHIVVRPAPGANG